MKAYCITKPNQFEIMEQPFPDTLAEDEVLMQVQRVGICGSDVHIFHGTNPFATYPRVWGHEFAGIVVQVGSNVKQISVGDHIVAEPYTSCGTCYACRHGRGNVCESVRVFGVHQDGGCREYVILKENKVHVVPQELSFKLAALAEPLTIGFQATKRGRVEAGDLVLIMGAGTIGLTCLMASKFRGARVIITDLYDEKLAYAQTWGADELVNVRERSLDQFLEELGERPNVIMDGVCSKSSLEWAVEHVSAAGRVVELGYGEIRSEISHKLMMQKEVDVCGTRLSANCFPDAIRYIEEHQAQLEDFVTQEYPIQQLKQAFDYVVQHPDKVRKAQIDLSVSNKPQTLL